MNVLISSIRNPGLSAAGFSKIEWARSFMPALNAVGGEFRTSRPFEGRKIAVSLHIEPKTAWLALSLRDAGADVYVTGSNPLSTRDDVCAALVSEGVTVNAWYGATSEEYERHIRETLACAPDLIIDDGGDLVDMLHGTCRDNAANVIGGCEETTTGLVRLRARAEAGALRFPVMAVNDASSKRLFDNVHGTGQSVWDAVMHATNNMVSGKTVVVAGYGYCGSGIAARAKGLGANVIVTEIDPFKALSAVLDGFRVMKMDDAAACGDIFVTATGCRDVITARHFGKMKDNAMLANAGHFDVEVSVSALADITVSRRELREGVRSCSLRDGRTLHLLGEGRLVNLACGNGHPAEIMDLSFTVQLLSLQYLLERGDSLAPGVYMVPERIDRRVAEIKAEAMGIPVDTLTPEQLEYLNTYSY